MDLRGIGCEVVDWIHLPQDRVRWWAVVSTVMNLWISVNVGEFLDQLRVY
jgi:hypothetical protein